MVYEIIRASLRIMYNILWKKQKSDLYINSISTALKILGANRTNYTLKYREKIFMTHPDKGGDIMKCQKLIEARKYCQLYYANL